MKRTIGVLVALVVATLAIPVPTAAAPGPVAEWSSTSGTDGRIYMADGQG